MIDLILSLKAVLSVFKENYKCCQNSLFILLKAMFQRAFENVKIKSFSKIEEQTIADLKF